MESSVSSLIIDFLVHFIPVSPQLFELLCYSDRQISLDISCPAPKETTTQYSAKNLTGLDFSHLLCPCENLYIFHNALSTLAKVQDQITYE